MKETERILKKIKHPYYKNAVIIIDVVMWEITCMECGTIHRIFLNDTELDPCCNNPKIEVRTSVQP